jgi:Ferrochelatase
MGELLLFKNPPKAFVSPYLTATFLCMSSVQILVESLPTFNASHTQKIEFSLKTNVLQDLGESGVCNLVVVPISFVSKHIEIVEEIDIESWELAEESGVTNCRHVPLPTQMPPSSKTWPTWYRKP